MTDQPEIKKEKEKNTEPELNSDLGTFSQICEMCKEKNLTESIYYATCKVCNACYCVHFASSIDPQHCVGCNSNVEMTEQTISKRTEHYDQEKDRVYVKNQKARQIYFSGLDWLFFSRKIRILSDLELHIAVEYHQIIYREMLAERDQRRVAHIQRNFGKKISVPSNTVVSSSTTTVKKSKTIKSSKPASGLVNLTAIFQQMLSDGLKPEDIIKLMGVKK